ncbi:hypothetical protein [Zhongshania aliphaticivorans]|jgi:hypothetical protein|uniref:Uncharacterized protein n=1 Tax=Zhongshania aliphaticivorans TaxID=1470434 RepID=A0A127M9S1_9GAMM|nr:hypothetical protein [Zhongshania aliphaticivorans]AMO69994.1 hypothetical protein AZF00_17550 [Zhongshania aliphaticivorans]
MGEKPLVEGLIEDAIELVKDLDSSGDNPGLVVWYYYEDAGDWRLVLAGKGFDKYLPKQEALAYQKVSEAISKCSLQSLPISLVKLVRTDDALPGAIGFLIGTPPDGFMQASFTDTTINGIFIKEMLIIRSALRNA